MSNNFLLVALIIALVAFAPDASALSLNFQASNQKVLGENPKQQQLNTPGELPSGKNAYTVKVIYMVPSNRSIQPGAEQALQSYIVRMQGWFREEMARLGYRPKSFVYERKSSILIPKINFVHVDQPDTAFQGSYQERWDKILNAIAAAGFPLWNRGELALIVAESQIQNPDGSFRFNTDDSFFFGGKTFFGSPEFGFSGIGVVTGETLARFPKELLTDNRRYEGLIISGIGPYPLVSGVSFPAFEETTLSSISSSAQGGALHELGHGLGLWHDFRNDTNFNGNLMGNGFRGIRGAFYPIIYPSDDMRLTNGSALQLNYNRFFNNKRKFTENTPPQVDIQTQNKALIINGQCGLEFSASDTGSHLAGALLIKNGNIVAETPLSGNRVTTTLTTYDYRPGELNQWFVEVFDTQGNRGFSSETRLSCPAGVNRAPHPYVTVSKRHPRIDEEIILGVGSSLDPDGDSFRMTVEWDLDGDGKFDTLPSTQKTFTQTYKKEGVYQIIARLTDEQGGSSVSTPIGIRVSNIKVRSRVE
jgi:hypothetical protein